VYLSTKGQNLLLCAGEAQQSHIKADVEELHNSSAGTKSTAAEGEGIPY